MKRMDGFDIEHEPTKSENRIRAVVWVRFGSAQLDPGSSLTLDLRLRKAQSMFNPIRYCNILLII